MNLETIQSLSPESFPRLIRADDTTYLYEIASGQAGSTAQVIGNAVAPIDTPILPVQGFIDVMVRFVANNRDYSGLGLEYVDPSPNVYAALDFQGGFNFANNKLTTQNIIDLLNLSKDQSSSTGDINVSGQTPPATLPMADGFVYQGQLFQRSNNDYMGRGAYFNDYNQSPCRWNGTQWEILDYEGSLLEIATGGNVASPWLSTWGGGAAVQSRHYAVQALLMTSPEANIITD